MMSSLWRNVQGAREARMRDVQLKENLTQNLLDSVKAIQYHQPIECPVNPESASSLCTALEAIFLHGLKDTFFKKARYVLGGDSDQRPQPSFWPLLLVLSHRDNIIQITSLQQINTEVGQCRAWIRLALNESLFSSYLSTILRNMNCSKPYYAHNAYIRDFEVLDVVQRYMEGVESCSQFEIPVNSSLLNTWSEEVLMLSGIWMPTMRSCPVAPGVDVASTLKDSEPETQSIPIASQFPNTTGIGHVLAIDQDEAINYILSNTPENFVDSMPKNKQNLNAAGSSSSIVMEKEEKDEPNQSESAHDSDSLELEKPVGRPDFSNLGNSLCGKTAWSSDTNEELDKEATTSTSMNSSDSSRSKSSLSLTDDSNFPTGSFVKTPNLRDVIKDLRKELILNNEDQENKPLETEDTTPVTADDPLLEGLGFEVISKTPSLLFDSQELQKMIFQVGTLSREYGLDSQDYQCMNCKDLLGTSISKAKVCAFTGQYFCSECMDPNIFMIPARVIHNWDFRRYPVSKRAAMFLLEFQHQPLINLKVINPLIYSGVGEMSQLQILRMQLNYLKAYLFTCREPVIDDLQKRVWPREYLYEHVHIYSISDLAQISNGSLASQLQKIVMFAQNHVKDCWLCSQKGFICEVCNNPKILYPFDIHTTYRCEKCCSVFHAKCLNTKKPCPKCERKKKRQNKSLIDAVHNT